MIGLRFRNRCFFCSVVFMIGSCLILCSVGCAPRWLLVNSNGIASYDRHTGRFEILWENKSAQVLEHHDTIFVDSILSKGN